MYPVYLVITLAVTAIVYAAYRSITGGRKTRRELEAAFGELPDKANENFRGFYWDEKLGHGDAGFHIDDMTWSDLDMDKVFGAINCCQTSVGEECLYALLREPSFDTDTLNERESLIACFSGDSGLRLDMQVYLSKLGKSDGGALSTFCYGTSAKRVKRPNVYRILAVAPFLCAGLIAVNVPLGILLLAASIITNGIVYYVTKGRIERELGSIKYFSALLWCAGKISKHGGLDSHIAGKNIKEGFSIFKKLGGKLSGLTQQRVSELDFLAEYTRILILSNIRNYNRIVNTLEKNSEEFRALYKSIGEVDAAIAVASFRKSLGYYTQPEFSKDPRIEVEDICHPLLKNPVPNSAELSFDLVTGSNASGKSTFIKAVAVNGILAQTIHTCTARRYRTPLCLVITSMAVRDNLSEGESYFITEIRSMKRILDMIPNVFCACFIDEILKGTNTIERIAASAYVLRHIKKMNCICAAATHDTELTRMLPGYRNYHFGEQVTEDGVVFDYAIMPGPSTTKNAIALLKFMGFDKEITDGAEKLVDGFEKTQVWDILP